MTKYNIAHLQSNRRVAQKSAFGFDDLLAILLLAQSLYCVWGVLA